MRAKLLLGVFLIIHLKSQTLASENIHLDAANDKELKVLLPKIIDLVTTVKDFPYANELIENGSEQLKLSDWNEIIQSVYDYKPTAISLLSRLGFSLTSRRNQVRFFVAL